MRRLLPLVIVLATACATDTVELSYGLEPGRRLEYELRLSADVERTLSREAVEQRIEATFRARQQILEPLSGGGATARMELLPTSLVIDGEPVNPGPSQAFIVALGHDGRVVEIDAPDEDDGAALGPVSVERLLPRLRPVLPGAAVAPGQAWRSDTTFTDRDGRFSLESESRLERLGTVADREAALVRTTYVSPVDRREAFANAVAELDGTDVGVQEAWFALDGFLLRSRGDSLGTYDVTFRPPGEEAGLQPVEGSLVVELHTEMVLVEEAGA
ncbi:MAG TPA: hypothetical protein VG709_05910 [Actinomycetota bacterium]|nr:hypothetical protein [Actinomycetota bacterium]